MNNSNPFVPQGSLLEQKNKKRARVKVAVFSIFALNILLISPLLIQGCKKEPEPDTTSLTNNTPDTSTNNLADTNAPALPSPSNAVVSNTAPAQPQAYAPPPAPVAQEPTANAQEYVVAKGDSFYLIAKKYHVKTKDLEAANPSIPPTKLKVGQKLQIPAGGSASADATSGTAATVGAADTSSAENYVVKAGDSLTKIAKHYGVSVKALRHANGLTTDRIKVGEKLKIPEKAATTETAAPANTPTQGAGAAGQAAPVTTTPAGGASQ